MTSRAREIFRTDLTALHQHTDRLFAMLMILQFLAGIAAALIISPQTWLGAVSQPHWHVWAAILLGGAISSLPVFLAWKHPGQAFTRHTIAVAQMLFSALLLHLTGGRIETHFHIFGSLAFLAIYRDWRVLLTATIVVAVDHFVRGSFWPQSIFGILTPSPWRWIEHVGWVLFVVGFLMIATRRGPREMKEVAIRQAKQEQANSLVEMQVNERGLQRLTEAQRIGQIGDWEYDHATQVITWSSQVFEIFGRDPRLGPPRNYEEMAAHYNAESQALLKEKVTLAIESGTAQEYELRAYRPDGTPVDVLGKAVSRKDESGKVVGLVGTVQDITTRKQSEAALKESESRYHSLFENMVEGYAYCRTLFEQDQLRDFNYVEVNNAFERLTGLKDVVGKKISEVIPGVHEDSPELFEKLGRVALTGKSEKFETHLNTLGIWFSITVYSHEREHFVAVFENITERKQAETALRTSEAEFRILAETMPQIIWVTRPDGWHTHFNQRWFDYTGQTLEESLGHGWLPPFHPEDQPVAAKRWKYANDTGEPYQIEYRLRGADGNYRWMLGRAMPLRDAEGVIVKWFGTCTDIHDLKAAELEISRATRELRASEAEFRALAEAMPQMVWITRPDGWNIYFSQQWMDYTGLTLEESLGHGWNKPFHPEDQQQAWDAWQVAVATSGSYSVESRLRRADGVYRWWLTRGVPQMDATGNILKWFGTCTDIHDLKLAEESLRLLGSGVEQANESIVITDAELELPGPRIVFVNPAFTRMTGYSAEEAIGKTPRMCQGPRTDRTVLNRLRHHLERGEAFHGEVINYRKDGTEYNLEWQVAPIRNAAGTITHFVAIQRDITERKRVEAELQKTHAELVNASRQAGMSEVATSVLHNVGNVLNSVNISCSVVAERVRKSRIGSVTKTAVLLHAHADDLAGFLTADPTGKRLPEYIGKLAAHLTEEQAEVLRELKLLGNNIDHIKEIVAMQQNYGRVSGITESIRVGELVEDSLRLNEESLGRHAVRVVCEFDDVPPITLEKHKVLQILVNLIRNAKHACTDSGRDDKQIKLRIAAGSGCVKVSVIDNGVGIPPGNLTRIFSHGFTTKAKGHGFGLHSGALAAAEMGGSLTVHSAGAGTGATFTLELPIQPASTARVHP